MARVYLSSASTGNPANETTVEYGTAVSKSIDFNNGTITKAKLTATETSGSFNYYMSANGSVLPTNQYKFNEDLVDSISVNDGTFHNSASAYYPFDGDATDQSDNSNNGTLSTATVVNAMDTTTGWTAGRGSISLNTTTFQEGTGAINLIKDVQDVAYNYMNTDVTSSNFTGKILNYYMYVKDQTTLDKLSAVYLFIGTTNLDTARFEYHKPASELTIGWNVISFDVSDPDATTGSPDIEAIDKIRININTNLATDTTVAGDIIFDYLNYGTPMKTKDRFGTDSSAYKFSTIEKIEVSGLSSIFTQEGSYTVSCWVKQNSTGTNMNVWNFNGDGSNRHNLNFAGTSIGFQRYNGTSYVAKRFQGVTGVVGEWVHVVCVNDAGAISLYLNGVAATNTGNEYAVANSGDVLSIGYPNSTLNGSQSIDGKIDEFIILNHSLNANEVASLYEMTNRHDLNDIYQTGKLNNAIELVGSSEYVEISSNTPISETAGSISLWAKFNSVGTNQTLVVSGEDEASGIEDGYDQFFIRLRDDSKIEGGWITNTEDDLVAHPMTIVKDTWYNIILTWSSSTGVDMFVNAVHQGGDLFTGNNKDDWVDKIIIGRAMPSSVTINPFDGTIDILTFYSSAISQADVTAIYNEGTGTEQDNAFFEPVTSGTSHTFLTSGTDLRWKAEGAGVISQIKVEGYH